jgi:uncharacterized protein HemY
LLEEITCELENKKMKKILICLVALLTGACNINSNAKNLAECEKIYQQIEQNAALINPLQKAQAMQQQGKECITTGMYDVWLASYYQDAGDYPASVKIVQSALDVTKTEEARPNLLQLLAEAELKTGDEVKAIKMAEAISHDYPQYVPILGFLGEIAARKEDWSKSFEYSKKSLSDRRKCCRFDFNGY